MYIPATIDRLSAWHAAGAAGPGPLAGHTVTREFAADYGLPDAPADDELLQDEALTDAALASVALDRADGESRAAVVVEADVADDSVRIVTGDGSSVSVLTDVPLTAWVAVYLQPNADAESPADGDDVSSLAGADLTWFAVQELADLLGAS